jgi:hypothetical protein
MLSRRGQTLAGLALLLAAIAPLRAQKRLSAAVDIGLTDGQGRDGDYDNRTLQGVRFAATARVGVERFAIFAEGAKESLGSLMGEKLTCRVGPTGQCMPTYPFMHGWSTSIGLLLRPRHFVEGRIGVGPAHYIVGGQEGTGLNALVGLADVAMYPVSHVGLAYAVQEIALARYHGDRLSIRPFTVALRVR